MFRVPHWTIALVALGVTLAHAQQRDAFRATVDPTIEVVPASVPDRTGNAQPVAASVDEAGVESEFLEGILLVEPKSDAELRAFLDRYEGVVVDDNSFPQSQTLGGSGTGRSKPTEFVVRINLARVTLANLDAQASAAGLRGQLKFSSQAGLLTFAAVLDARSAGFDVVRDWVMQANQTLPSLVFESDEGPSSNAFDEDRYGEISNVDLAWQFVAAHGIDRRVRVAIVDDGFWLTETGHARGQNSDFPEPPARPLQFDLSDKDTTADGFSAEGTWHGTGMAGVAVGIMNNKRGFAGTGSLVGDPLLIKVSITNSQVRQGVRRAIGEGADVVVMGWSRECNFECRETERDDDPFKEAVASGSRAVFVAAAGNVNREVGHPYYRHPCIESHVICVGALTDPIPVPVGTKAPFSNFGAAVDIFAPTNVPTMWYPDLFDFTTTPPTPLDPFGPEKPQRFGGTSGASAFIGGVAAMMKALNPNLNSDDVAGMLIATAKPGVAPVTGIVDALAAVRRAAQGKEMLPDRFDRLASNDLETSPTELTTATAYDVKDLNIDHQDRDFFKFEAPSGSTAVIGIEFARAFGNISIHSFETLRDGCAAPVFTGSDSFDSPSRLRRSRRLTYRVPGGPLRLALKSDGVNAYNLKIRFESPTFVPDKYEPNNHVVAATYLNSMSVGKTPVAFFDPRFTIEANIHSDSDVDYYIVQGASLTRGEQVLLNGYPAVRLYGNESPVNLQVYELGPGDTQGALVSNVGGQSCVPEALSVRLNAGAYYLVRVSGAPGHYVLSNGIGGEKRRLPSLVRDRIYEVLHPSEPVESALRAAGRFVLVGNPAYDALQAVGPGTRMLLFDVQQNLIAESTLVSGGAHLPLARMRPGQVYGLYVTRTASERQDSPLQLYWQPARPLRVMNALTFQTGGAGAVGESGVSKQEPAQVAVEGEQVFAADPTFQPAINTERVKGILSAFAGATLRDQATRVTLRFLDQDRQRLGEIALPLVTVRETHQDPGLIQVRLEDSIPAGTAFFGVAVSGKGEDDEPRTFRVDNIELVLFEYPAQ